MAVAIAALIFACGWATQAVFTPSAELEKAEDVGAIVAVREGNVEAHLDVVASATWSMSSGPVNRLPGTVTTLDFTPGSLIDVGDLVYTVDLVPVRVAQGAVPMHRPLVEGAKGADVVQLQRLLAALGYFSGVEDGVFGPQTATAVKRWQRSLSVEQTGGVDLGSLIFVPELPARPVLVEEFSVGDVVSGGETAFNVLASTATFVVSASENQIRKINEGQLIEIDSPVGTTWQGSVGAISTDYESGEYQIAVLPLDDLPICGQECEVVPEDGSAITFDGRIVIQQELSGAVVTTAAIRTRADGTAVVFTEDGDPIDVTVVATANGQSLVEGVEIGTYVRAPAGKEE